MKFTISLLLMMAGMEGNQALYSMINHRYGWATAHLLVAVAFSIGGWLFLERATKPREPEPRPTRWGGEFL